MLLLRSDASNHLQPTNQPRGTPPPPKRAEERPRKTPHTSVFSERANLFLFFFGGEVHVTYDRWWFGRNPPRFHQVDIGKYRYQLFTRGFGFIHPIGGCLGFRESTVVPVVFWKKMLRIKNITLRITCTLGHLIASFKHISTTTTMPCDCPGKLRSWVAERVKTVCLQEQREA